MHRDLPAKIADFSQVLSLFPELCYAGEPVLRQPAQPVSLEAGMATAQALADILVRFRQRVGYGRGLAAPQIGRSQAVFVTYLEDKIQVYINPEVIERSSELMLYRENCLSCGDIAVDVARPEWIVLRWMDEQGKEHEEKFDGLRARLLQHEEAHLRGLLNVDEAEPGSLCYFLFDPLKEQLRKKSAP